MLYVLYLAILLLKLMVGQAVGHVGDICLFLPMMNELHIVSMSSLGVLDLATLSLLLSCSWCSGCHVVYAAHIFVTVYRGSKKRSCYAF